MTAQPLSREDERAQVLAAATAAKRTTPLLRTLSTDKKNQVLHAAAAALVAAEPRILAANTKDVEAGRAAGMAESLVDRLALDSARIAGIAEGLTLVAGLPDPVGVIVDGRIAADGIRLTQVKVPLGVMGVVYEARPNVTIDAFGLAFKAGNACLLRGSKSARNTNQVLVEIVQEVLADADLPQDIVQLLPCDSHDSVTDLITARGIVDVVIPRGGAALINAVVMNATVPTIETGTGNCHLYIDKDADIDMACALAVNGKTRRCSVCNATETLLLDKALEPAVMQKITGALVDAGVTLHGNVDELAAVGINNVVQATEEDWAEEYLSLDIAVKLVDGVDEAIAHIAQYSSGHTEAIVSNNIATAEYFATVVDAAAVSINASTAYTDGQQYGMGAEIGISTQKLHARGPLGLPELTTTKWIVRGTGQCRA